jgi:uncharacterized protein (DUF433 family)
VLGCCSTQRLLRKDEPRRRINDVSDLLQRIEIDPKVMVGKPVIRGTRIPVELILEKLAAGLTPEDLRRSYPRLTAEDISAALLFAAQSLHADSYMPTLGEGR